MTRRRVIFLPSALADLERVFDDYASRGGVDLAGRFFEAAFATADSLAEFSNRGRLSPFPWARREKLRSMRVAGFPNSLLFYRVRRDRVEVIRIIDARRDLVVRRAPA